MSNYRQTLDNVKIGAYKICMDTPRVTKAMRDYWRAMGAKGGAIGGVRRAAALSPERRKEIARMGGLARRKSPVVNA